MLDGDEINESLIALMEDWVKTHISLEDKQFIAYFNELQPEASHFAYNGADCDQTNHHSAN
jgi:hypothetical protein